MKTPLQWLCGALCAFFLLGFAPLGTAAQSASGIAGGARPSSEKPASIAAPKQDSEIGFYVQAQLPQNQLSEVSYFDLRTQPGQTETLEVLVGNKNTSTLRVRVRAVCASTTNGGIIDYKNHPRHDDTLPFRFCDASTVEQEIIEIPAGQTAVARVVVQMPQQRYEGSVLGSVLVEKIPREEWENTATSASASSSAPAPASGAQAIQLKNRYYYAVAVRLWQGRAVPAPNFTLGGISAEKVKGRPAVVYTIQNPVTNVAVGMEGDFTVYREGDDEPIAQVLATPLEMANNSTMEYGIAPTSGHLPDGHYTSVVQLRYNGQSWDYTADFDITGEQAREINIVQPPPPQSHIPTWLLVLLMLLAVLAVGFAAAFVYMYQRRAPQKTALSGTIQRTPRDVENRHEK